VTLVSLFEQEFLDAHEELLTPAQKFQRYNALNPQVYEALKKVALDLLDRGHERISINMCFEVVRWQMFMRTNDEEGFKMNNTYRSRFARLLAEKEPRLANAFETRRLHTVD
jgi:hypothetical protein